MSFRHYLIAVLIVSCTSSLVWIALVVVRNVTNNQTVTRSTKAQSPIVPQPSLPPQTPSPQPPTRPPQPLPVQKTLQNTYHIFQTFNNCGPAALSMALSYYGINISQDELGRQLRPYQHPKGDNDDKSVTLEELAKKAQEEGLIPYHRPNGTIKLLQQFIAHDMPVITRTWLKEDDDIGHYRVVKGYDNAASELIQDDSLQGKNLKYDYATFNTIWSKFNYEYLVLVPPEKQQLAEAILGENADPKTAWENAVTTANKLLADDPNDVTARFNLSVALYHTGQYQQAVAEFEKIQDKLPFRTLWYQMEPIQAYYELKQYGKVFEITDKILSNNNRAFSELYLLRGQIYEKQGNKETARSEYEKARFYNKNMPAAHKALEQLN